MQTTLLLKRAYPKHNSKIFRKDSYPQPLLKPFLKTPSTLKVIIDYKSGWA